MNKSIFIAAALVVFGNFSYVNGMKESGLTFTNTNIRQNSLSHETTGERTVRDAYDEHIRNAMTVLVGSFYASGSGKKEGPIFELVNKLYAKLDLAKGNGDKENGDKENGDKENGDSESINEKQIKDDVWNNASEFIKEYFNEKRINSLINGYNTNNDTMKLEMRILGSAIKASELNNTCKAAIDSICEGITEQKNITKDSLEVKFLRRLASANGFAAQYIKEKLVELGFSRGKRIELGLTWINSYAGFFASMYFESINDFQNFEETSVKFENNRNKFLYNPIPLTKETIGFFPLLRTLHIYSKEDEKFEDRKCYKKVIWDHVTYSEYFKDKKDDETYKNVRLTIDDVEKYKLDNVPECITELGEYCFSGCSDLASIIIPDSVTSIGEGCFSYCSNLKIITIPDSVTSIGKWCFRGCSSLANINIPNSITSIEDGCFYKCANLKSIIIPNSVTSMGKECFHDCSSLTSVTLSTELKDLKQSCFSGCYNLESINIPNSVTSLGNWCFYDCSSLTSVTLPTELEDLGQDCFICCSNLKSIRIPNSVTSIEKECFYCCSSLTSVTLRKKLKALKQKCFSDCSNLKSINIPKSVASIGDESFRCCSNLESIRIPNSVTSIEKECFYGCSSLTSVILPKKLKALKQNCFSCCSSLKSIIIPNSVTSIEKECFYGCSSLTSVILPMNLSIGEMSFANCTSLKEINSIGNRNIVTTIIAHQIDPTNTVKESLESAKILPLFLASGILHMNLSIGEMSFADCTSLKEINVIDGNGI